MKAITRNRGKEVEDHSKNLKRGEKEKVITVKITVKALKNFQSKSRLKTEFSI